FLFQNVILVALAFVVWWGTFFPLISEAVTGTRASVGPPWFDKYIVPLAFVLVALSGIGPLVPWRRLTLASVRRGFVLPGVAAVVTVAVLLAVPGAWAEPKAAAFAGVVAFVLTSVGQELWRGMRARQASTRESAPAALAGVVRRNRRRYGGYVVHAGFATLLLGVAISSSFQHAKDVSLKPGQSARVGGFDIKYVRATSRASAEKISLGAVLDVTKDGRHVATLRTTRGFYPSQDVSEGIVGRFFGGESVSEVGLRAGLGRDIWTVINPNITPLAPIIEQGNRTFRRAMVGIMTGPARDRQQAVGQLFALRDAAVTAVARRFVTSPWPADFRFIVSPLATWIWLGAIVTFLGGLLALWPAPAAARRRVSAGYAARVARELARTTQ
ncbi:MAG: cytochrome c-type biogenesis CcmF C-terminal domain-containing protein, partial [Conexibacter sp.]